MKTPFAIRRAIYSLDPNRHLASDIPFREYLMGVIERGAGGIPVPEAYVELFRHFVRQDIKPWLSEPPPLDISWLKLAERLGRMIREIPASPLPRAVEEEEAWRKRIFTYPPGRYAILKSGSRLKRLASAPSSELLAWAKSFRGSRNPFDCLIAKALRDAWDLRDDETQDHDSLLWSPADEAFQAVGDANASKLRALLAAGLDLGETFPNGETRGQRLAEAASNSTPCLRLLKNL